MIKWWTKRQTWGLVAVFFGAFLLALTTNELSSITVFWIGAVYTGIVTFIFGPWDYPLSCRILGHDMRDEHGWPAPDLFIPDHGGSWEDHAARIKWTCKRCPKTIEPTKPKHRSWPVRVDFELENQVDRRLDEMLKEISRRNSQ